LHYYRDNSLNLSEVSETTGFSSPTISNWNKCYDETYNRVKKEEMRGHSNVISGGFKEFIKEAGQEYIEKQTQGKKISKVSTFIKWLKKEKREELKNHPAGKSRRVITELLICYDYYKEKVNKNQYAYYSPRIKQYYPNAQIVLDGKEQLIEFNNRKHKFTVELSIDICSNAITSKSVSKEETAEVVYDVIKKHNNSHGRPLSILMDNSKANLSKKVNELIVQENIIEVCAYPGNAKTKGLIEGENAKINAKIGVIQIQGENEEEICESIVNAMVNLYVEMRNEQPRCGGSKCKPLELMNMVPTEQEREEAIKALKEQSVKSQENKASKKFKILVEKEVLITGLMGRNQLEISDEERFVKTLRKYDMQAIQEAETDFFAYSKRDSFEESKRTGHYFCGIVRNKQSELDKAKKATIIRERYLIGEENKRRQEKILEREQEIAEEKKQKQFPEKVIVSGYLNLKKLFSAIGKTSNIFINKIKRGINTIINKQNWKVYLERSRKEVMALTEFNLDERLNIADGVVRLIKESKQNGINSVSFF